MGGLPLATHLYCFIHGEWLLIENWNIWLWNLIMWVVIWLDDWFFGYRSAFNICRYVSCFLLWVNEILIGGSLWRFINRLVLWESVLRLYILPFYRQFSKFCCFEWDGALPPAETAIDENTGGRSPIWHRLFPFQIWKWLFKNFFFIPMLQLISWYISCFIQTFSSRCVLGQAEFGFGIAALAEALMISFHNSGCWLLVSFAHIWPRFGSLFSPVFVGWGVSVEEAAVGGFLIVFPFK